MTVLMENLTWQEFDKKRKDSVVILPVGSLEQHGPMLPLSVDKEISTGLATMVAKQVGGLVAPSLSFGYKSAPLSGGGPLFPGTIDLNGATLTSLVYDILEELIRDGVKKLFVLNGHFENEAFIIEAIDLLSKKYEDVTFIESSWWDQVSDEIMDKVFDEVAFPGWDLEHAAIAETSLMLYFKPELVHMERFMEEEQAKPLGYTIYPANKCKVPESGLLSTARSSSKEKGELLAEDISQRYIDIVNNIFK